MLVERVSYNERKKGKMAAPGWWCSKNIIVARVVEATRRPEVKMRTMRRCNRLHFGG
jgi:hypothetical protein